MNKTYKAFIERADGSFVKNPEVTKLEIKHEIEEQLNSNLHRLINAISVARTDSFKEYNDLYEDIFTHEVTGGDLSMHFDESVEPVDDIGSVIKAIDELILTCERYIDIMEICK